MAWERKLLKLGFIIEHDPGLETGDIFVKIFTPFFILCQEAQKKNLKIPLIGTPEIVAEPSNPFIRILRHILKFFTLIDEVASVSSAIFRIRNLGSFQGGTDLNPCLGSDKLENVFMNFFPKSKRIFLTNEVITKTIIYPKDIMKNVHFDRAISIHELLKKDIYASLFPVHDGPAYVNEGPPNPRSELRKSLANFFFKLQPLDEVRDYFGEKIALYFSFIGFYTLWLWPPAIAGLICFIYGVIYAYSNTHLDLNNPSLINVEILTQQSGNIFDNPAAIPFAAFMCIWATIFIEFWKRKNSYLIWWFVSFFFFFKKKNVIIKNLNINLGGI